jgi:hypothetical protein
MRRLEFVGRSEALVVCKRYASTINSNPTGHAD